eukprot:3854344-Pyramimonas_sp.AAC.1
MGHGPLGHLLKFREKTPPVGLLRAITSASSMASALGDAVVVVYHPVEVAADDAQNLRGVPDILSDRTPQVSPLPADRSVVRSILAQSLCRAHLRRVTCVEVSHHEFQRAVRALQAKPSGPTRRYDKPIKMQEL